MRSKTDRRRLTEFLRALGARVTGPGTAYLTGGATALLHGWRDTTNDVDLSFDPEPGGVFEAIGALKNELDINVELASPAHFVPEVPGWRERSPSVARFGPLEVRHYDLRAPALFKLARGLDRDLRDVRAMILDGHLEFDSLRAAFDTTRDAMIRFPSLEPDRIERALSTLMLPPEPAEDGS